MAEVKKKLQTRKGHKFFVRNTIATVKELLPESDLGAISPEIKFRLQAHLSTLERQQKEIEILDNAIADLVEDELIEKKTVEALDFRATIEESICWIKAVLSSAQSAGILLEQSQSSSINVSIDSSANITQPQNVQQKRVNYLSSPYQVFMERSLNGSHSGSHFKVRFIKILIWMILISSSIYVPFYTAQPWALYWGSPYQVPTIIKLLSYCKIDSLIVK